MTIPGLAGLHPLDLAKRSVKEFFADDMPVYAAALSYHALLALFPFVIFLIALLGFLQIPGFFTWVLEESQNTVPSDAYHRVQQVVTELQAQERGGLLSFGILASLWVASTGMRAILTALNTAYDVAESRALWKRYLLSIVYTLLLATLMIVAIGLMLLGPQAVAWLAGHVGLSETFVTVWAWARFPVAALLLMVVAGVLYSVGPNIDQPFRLVTPGSVVAVGVWFMTSAGFSLYVSHLADFDATYGSLGSVIVTLLYFFISSAVFLLGAEINAEVHYAATSRPQREA